MVTIKVERLVESQDAMVREVLVVERALLHLRK
jgi:hypothetical protein